MVDRINFIEGKFNSNVVVDGLEDIICRLFFEVFVFLVLGDDGWKCLFLSILVDFYVMVVFLNCILIIYGIEYRLILFYVYLDFRLLNLVSVNDLVLKIMFFLFIFFLGNELGL